MSMTVAIPAFVETDYVTERGKPMPDLNHGIVQLNLGAALHARYKKHYRFASEVHVEMPTRDRIPDLVIYPLRPFDPDENEIVMSEPPLGAIEILSEMQSIPELMENGREYFTRGTKSYWLVVPSLRTIHVFSTPNDYEIYRHTDILKDTVLNIELDLADIFS
jgi:Uma2 family endonuclease